MKCVLLAAGASTRLHPLTITTPKCLLTVGDASILDLTLRSVAANGIAEIIVVTGFEGGQIRQHVEKEFPSLAVHWIDNPRYPSTNNAFSLLCARDMVAGETFVLLDSDIVFDEAILRMVVTSQHENAAAVRTKGEIGEEEIKVKVDTAWRIQQIGKNIPLPEAKGESIGIEKFSSAASTLLFSVLDKRMYRENRINEFYEASFQEMIDQGTIIQGIETGDLRSIEIDTESDLSKARKMFSE
jgi:choline kinase